MSLYSWGVLHTAYRAVYCCVGHYVHTLKVRMYGGGARSPGPHFDDIIGLLADIERTPKRRTWEKERLRDQAPGRPTFLRIFFQKRMANLSFFKLLCTKSKFNLRKSAGKVRSPLARRACLVYLRFRTSPSPSARSPPSTMPPVQASSDPPSSTRMGAALR